MEGSETKTDQGGTRENCKICVWLEEWAGTPSCGAFCIKIFESVYVKSLYDPKACAICYQESRTESNYARIPDFGYTHYQGD